MILHFFRAAWLAFSMTLGAQFGYPGVPGPGKIVQVAPQPATIRVGAGGQFPVPSAAAAAARDGDVIEILAGDYSGDVAIWRQHNLIIRGVGGRAHLKAEGKHAEGKAIWVIKGTNATIENIEFSGAKVPSRNGAGIRQEGAGVLIRGCYFHDNENGILAGKNPLSDVVIENSEFAFNGYGDGQTHNMYIGQVRSFTLRYSYSHHAKIGHNVKSRALVNYILYNRIMDEDTGESSYAIDLPNGGLTFIIGNLIQQGPRTQNRTIVSYGKEGLQNPASAFYLINNTIVNDHMEGKFVAIQAGTTIARLMNNIFSGPGTILTGPGEEVNNLISEKSGFVNAAEFDYHLTRNSPAIDAGTNPGSAHDFGLQPVNQYVHTAKGQKRVAIKTVDMGAYEYHGER